MKKGYIGPFQLGALHASAQALKIAEDITQKHGADIEGVFYATAFQAGIDEFYIPYLPDHIELQSDFLRSHTCVVSRRTSSETYRLLDGAFSAYLPTGWHSDEKFSSVWALQSFVADLLEAMSVGASLLSPWGIPDIAEAQARLPSELSIPIGNLLSGISDLSVPSPFLLKEIEKEDLDRFNDILKSDIFSWYSKAQSTLDDMEMPLSSSVSMVSTSSRNLFLKNSSVLGLKRTVLGLLQFSPKLIDAAFGKLPGTLAEYTSKIGVELINSRRRIVIYDFRPAIENILFSNLERMIKGVKPKSLNEFAKKIRK